MLERLSDSQVREIFVESMKTAKNSNCCPIELERSIEKMNECRGELERREEFRNSNISYESIWGWAFRPCKSKRFLGI
jgi:hypothetical protein